MPRASANIGARSKRTSRGCCTTWLSKKRPGPVGSGRPTGLDGGPDPPVAAQPSSSPVLRAQLNATTTSGYSRLIIVNLHVAGVRRPLRALLDSGATIKNFRESCLSMLPSCIRVREGPGQVVGKLADRKPHRIPRREVSLPYTSAAMIISW